MTPLLTRLHRASRSEDGFTMIAAIMILLVSSLLVTATLVSAGGDVTLTHNSTNQKKAYYAAMAGLSAYKYNLNTSSKSTYWTTCPSISEKTLAGTTDEHYSVVTMHSEGHTQAECESGKQAAIIETSGSADGTFRIESTGTAGSGSEKATRKLVGTFSHPGFLNYVYLTNYEILDPAAQPSDPADCEFYYKERKEKNLLGSAPSGCGNIEFASEDKINGPMHTNDASELCAEGSKKPTFGRTGHHDKIEMNGGHYAASGCKNEFNLLGEFTEKGPTLTPPETDTELLETAEGKFIGRTEIELKATNPNTLQRTNNKGEKQPVEDFPANGVIYVENEGSCGVKYSPYGTDVDYETDQTCGDAYVHGEYTEALTIAAQNDVIINGNLKTKTEGGKPIGEGRLGLIATNFVRVYHPVEKGYNTKNVVAAVATEPPISGKCVTKVETTGKVLRSTEITGITTTGLAVGAEVEGTVAGQIESGTKISALNATLKTITLSKAAKPAAKELGGKIVNGSTEVTGITTTGLEVGQEVEGTVSGQIESGTTITEIKTGNKIKLSKAAKTVTKELSASIFKSTEVTGITTTGLAVGEEVEGTVAGQIESGTTISSINASAKTVTLSKAAKPSAKELSASILRSTEVTGITTTGLAVGDEVEGSSSQIASGTTIAEIKTGNKIKLSQAAKPAAEALSAKITSGSTEVKEISTTGLEVGQEVEGPITGQLESGTTITKIETGNKIKLSKAAKKTETTSLKFYGETTKLKFYGETTKLKFALHEEATNLKFYGETTKLKFYIPTGYEYNSTLNQCHKIESGYDEYRASENRYIKNCESGSTYTSNGFCEYENNSKTCSAKAENQLSEPVLTIDAAILSTGHSFIVDNFLCGKHLGELTVWGAIAQFWRGTVGQGEHGYIKNYNYDERLAYLQPPDFLSPTSSQLKLDRITAASS
jgi:Tfp pilus assembly protein PilX